MNTPLPSEQSATNPPITPITPVTPPVLREADWQRLDPRMLLVHPVREVLRFLPVLIGLLIAGSGSGGRPWELIGVVAPIVLGVLRYLTTRFRISGGRIELRRGLLQRHVLSTRVDRVRTVDLTSSPIHRLLGLTTMRIGTGTAQSDDSEDLDLDGLPRDRAQALRRELLRTAATDEVVDAGAGGSTSSATIVRFDPRWLRFAPFTGGGLVVTAAVFGGLSQVLNAFDAWDRVDPESWSLGVPSGLGIALLTVVVVAAVSVVSVLGYLITNGGFRLTRGAGSWHLTRGLITTRETTLDEDRVAGVGLGEPLALRLAGGRSLTAIVTGVDRKQSGSATLVPPADRDVALRVAGIVLGTVAPMREPLVPHGPAAERRRLVRAVVPALAAPGVAVVAVVSGAAWWWLVPAAGVVLASVGLGLDRARGLAHVLVDGFLVARSGSLARRRDALATEHVIGWTFRATWFQRRVGLTTLIATTAGGRGGVTLLDVPERDAEGLTDAALPGLVSQFHV